MLTKPNILRLVAFTLFFAAALYYPVREVLSYECPRTPPREYRYRIIGAKLNDFELRPRVSGRWKWVALGSNSPSPTPFIMPFSRQKWTPS